jgi:hypothetical protein
MTFTRRQILTVALAWAVSLAAVAVLCVVMARPTTDDRADLIQRGAYASWDVTDGCLDSHEACSEALDRQNAELKPFGLEIMEDGSTIPIKLADANRKIESGQK